MDTQQYKEEVAKAQRAKQAKAFMQPYFDEASEMLFEKFMSLQVYDPEVLKNEVITLNKSLVEPQLWLQSIIDTGKLAQVELDKIN